MHTSTKSLAKSVKSTLAILRNSLRRNSSTTSTEHSGDSNLPPTCVAGGGISHIDEAAEVDVIIPYLFRSYIIVVSKDRREAKCPILKL